MEKENVMLTKSYPFSKYGLRSLRNTNMIEQHLANSLLAQLRRTVKDYVQHY